MRSLLLPLVLASLVACSAAPPERMSNDPGDQDFDREPSKDGGSEGGKKTDDAGNPVDPGDGDDGGTVESDGGFIPAPSTPAITVAAGLNTMDLSSLGVPGAKVEFTAIISGNILTLSGVDVVTPAASGVRVLRPRFVMMPPGAAEVADPSNAFGSLDQAIPKSRVITMGVGYLSLGNYVAGTKIRLRFARVEPSTVTDAEVPGACKNAGAFTASAVPQFKINTTVGQTCIQCHGAGGGAVSALDLTKVGRDDKTACSAVLPKGKSGALIARPTGAGHAGGTAGNVTNYRAGINAWLGGE